MSNGESYTGALYQVLETLGRIDGKFDSLDARVRSIEQYTASREATDAIERVRLDKMETQVSALVNREEERITLRKHWGWILVALVPLGLASFSAITQIVRFF